ncbi:MAG: helix-turn-helix domain-containing protein [Desulfurivibrionaceae bacterium]
MLAWENYSQLSVDERNAIQRGLNKGQSQGAIARELGCPASAVSREICRNRVSASYDAPMVGVAARKRHRRGPVKLRRGSPLRQEIRPSTVRANGPYRFPSPPTLLMLSPSRDERRVSP